MNTVASHESFPRRVLAHIAGASVPACSAILFVAACNLVSCRAPIFHSDSLALTTLAGAALAFPLTFLLSPPALYLVAKQRKLRATTYHLLGATVGAALSYWVASDWQAEIWVTVMFMAFGASWGLGICAVIWLIGYRRLMRY
jgi:hypothetical protein